MSREKLTQSKNLSDRDLLDEWVAHCGGLKKDAAKALGVSSKTISTWYKNGIKGAWRRVIELRLGQGRGVSEAVSVYGLGPNLLEKLDQIIEAVLELRRAFTEIERRANTFITPDAPKKEVKQ